MIKLAPSLLAADMTQIGAEIEKARACGADYLHFDVMDGMFVPNMSFGQCLLKSVSKIDLLPFDVHLMIVEPERYIEEFAKAGARVITVHAEATNHLQRALSQIRACGCLAGVAFCPATPPDCLKYVLNDVDLALVMTVNPGFGGQKFLPATAEKVGEIRRMFESAGKEILLEVDGGITVETAPTVIRQGANVLVAGSAFFGAKDPASFAQAIKALG